LFRFYGLRQCKIHIGFRMFCQRRSHGSAPWAAMSIQAKVTYGVRSPQFIWAPVHSCKSTHWLRPRNSPLPPYLGSYMWELLKIGFQYDFYSVKLKIKNDLYFYYRHSLHPIKQRRVRLILILICGRSHFCPGEGILVRKYPVREGSSKG